MGTSIKKLLPSLVVSAAIVAGTLIIQRSFTRLDAGMVNLTANIVVIFLLLLIYLIQKKAVFKKFRDRILHFIPPITVIAFFAVITSVSILRLNPISNVKQCIGKSPGAVDSFMVYPDYQPTGYMGDTGDLISVNKSLEVVRFEYKVMGKGPQEWDFKYIGGELNPNPAKFAGIMYLYGPAGFGEGPAFDLRSFSSAIEWEARSLSGEVNVEFVIGGVGWVWDEKKKVKIEPSCPGSLRQKNLGAYSLTEEWQSFKVDLSHIPKEEFKNVEGGFAWIITWGSNGIEGNEEGTGPDQNKTFEFEIRNIRYKK